MPQHRFLSRSTSTGEADGQRRELPIALTPEGLSALGRTAEPGATRLEAPPTRPARFPSRQRGLGSAPVRHAGVLSGVTARKPLATARVLTGCLPPPAQRLLQPRAAAATASSPPPRGSSSASLRSAAAAMEAAAAAGAARGSGELRAGPGRAGAGMCGAAAVGTSRGSARSADLCRAFQSGVRGPGLRARHRDPRLWPFCPPVILV